GGMGAGHLHHESAFDLSLGLGPLDECQAGVHSNFRKPAVQVNTPPISDWKQRFSWNPDVFQACTGNHGRASRSWPVWCRPLAAYGGTGPYSDGLTVDQRNILSAIRRSPRLTEKSVPVGPWVL